MNDLKEILRRLEILVRAAGNFIRAEALKFDRSMIEYKGVNDLVSYVDRKSEEILVSGCLEIIPGATIIGEEGGIREGNTEIRWIMDPLDGTTNFIHGLPAYCISVGLERNGELQAGIIYDIPNDTLYAAGKGLGATANGKPIRVRPAERLSHSLLATGFPYAVYGRNDAYLSVFRDFVYEAQGVRRFGSAALDLAWLAQGRFDGFYEIGLNAWDVAAGALLVREAGGMVTDFGGSQNFLFGRQIVASAPGIHHAMLAVIHRYFN